MAVVASFSSLSQAELARTALEAAGIDAWLENENTVAVQWLYATALGGVRVIVHEEDAGEASEILQEIHRYPQRLPVAPPDAVAEPIEPAAEEIRCPNCASPDVAIFPRIRVLAVLMVVLLGTGVAVDQLELFALTAIIIGVIVLLAHSYRCRGCGERWSPRQRRPMIIAGQEPPDQPCPRCGSLETYKLEHRRFKAATMLLQSLAAVAFLVWPLMTKRQCAQCGTRF